MKSTQAFDKKDRSVSFGDTSIAFKNKSDRELFLSYLIFWLTKSPFLVKFLSQAAKITLAMGLPVKPIIKSTVFRQFCGGEKESEYANVIGKLGRSGIGAILDYSVEGTEDETGFEATKKELLKIIEKSKSNPDIPCTCMKMTAIGPFELYQKVTAKETLTSEEQREWNSVKERLETICKASFDAGKPIYIDAEETWIQQAIDDLAEEMMSRYNRSRAIVFTTLQLYRWDRNDYFLKLIGRARAEGYKLGIKIVRGAYIEKERERAAKYGYRSPINDTKEDTDREYDKAVQIFIDNIDVVEICVGTHNEASCRLLIELMAEKDLPNDHPHIYFSQLYGMSDNISFNLANAGYNVSKYLPYGPVESTLPYLARRAEENTAIAGQMSKELEIIIQERNRRKAAK
ncbi:proline dehydrogenase family protein [uncultured Desulfosarcina sp.]|uniref:proline dehydrogenase family protein n=1 Tax=uncultured Desulfosarcina sp. TaxID=218289 RepID=UPI0029C64CCD|nr:proline dehydrogenase family protein [uncultured Desulfosarcina sp.]